MGYKLIIFIIYLYTHIMSTTVDSYVLGNLSVQNALTLTSSLSATDANLTNTTNQIKLGTTNITTISAVAPSASRVYTLPDTGTNSAFTFDNNTQTLTNKTLQVPLGSVTAPSYSFGGDVNTGFYSPGAEQIASTVNGVQSVLFTSATTEVKNALSCANAIYEVRAYTTASSVLATDGKRINTVNFVGLSTVTLPTNPTAGTIYTIIRLSAPGVGNNVTINAGAGNFIDNGVNTSLVLSNQYQRVSLVFVSTIWYIV
jgi:hypothetical protein